MKVKVADYNVVNENVWIKSIATFFENGKYEDRLVTLRVNKDMFFKSIVVPIEFPFVIDVKFKKGVGIQAIKQLKAD